MAIHPAFPTSPYEVLNPEHRWFPADEDLRESSYDRLVPPLVNKIRREVKEWRGKQYEGVSATSKALLNWWFNRQHINDNLVRPLTGLQRSLMPHTMQDDFKRFLSYSGLHNEPQDVINKMCLAFQAAWSESGPTLAAPDEGDLSDDDEFVNPYLLSAQEIERTLALRR